jgi:hypothetical protein
VTFTRAAKSGISRRIGTIRCNFGAIPVRFKSLFEKSIIKISEKPDELYGDCVLVTCLCDKFDVVNDGEPIPIYNCFYYWLGTGENDYLEFKKIS